MGFGLFSMALLGMAALIRPSRRTYWGVTVMTLCAIVLTPSLQAQASALAFDQFRARQSDQAAAVEDARNSQQTINASQRTAVEAAPYAPPAATLASPITRLHCRPQPSIRMVMA